MAVVGPEGKAANTTGYSHPSSLAEETEGEGEEEAEEGEREERPVVRGCLFNHVINGHPELRFLADVAEEVYS